MLSKTACPLPSHNIDIAKLDKLSGAVGSGAVGSQTREPGLHQFSLKIGDLGRGAAAGGGATGDTSTN